MPNPDAPHWPDGRRVEAELRTTASPEEVWRAWTDPAALSRWFTDEARGEAKPGATLVWGFRGFGEMAYPVLVAESPKRLVFAGEIPGRGPFALEVVIRRSGGVTLIRLVNSGFLNGADWDEEYEGVRSGWSGALALLQQSLERHRDQPRHSTMIVRPAPSGAAELYRSFTDADRLAAWLTREGDIGELGARVSLVLQDGTRLSGRVIAATGREKALTWDEEGGTVVELKGFAAPGGRMAGLRLTTWGDGAAAGRLARLERTLAPAVERLAAVLGKQKEERPS